MKETVKTRLKQGLREMGVFWGQSASSEGAGFQSSPSLTFEQQRELLQMQLERERLRNANRPEGLPQFDVSQNLCCLNLMSQIQTHTLLYLSVLRKLELGQIWT